LSEESALHREVEERVAEVLDRIGEAARRAGRNPSDITLVGASKRQPLDRIVAAVRCGVRLLGENYVQEARDKRPALEALLRESDCPLPRWHMIGHLQRNKVRTALSLFDVVETVDRVQLAQEIDRRIADAVDPEDLHGTREIRDVLAQVNTSGEPQKAGVAPEELSALLAGCAPLEHVRVVGLMTLPAPSEDAAAVRGPFARLRELRDHLREAPGGLALRELSMGMSGDFELAVEEGATLVRVGTALFGARKERT
jgi:pyridoxal phosphate enzyme (YggS family)